ALLLVPQLGYFAELSAFSREHRDYLFLFGELRLLGILAHNSTFLVGLLIVSLASYVARQTQRHEAHPSSAPAPAEPPPRADPQLVWLARAWVFWPQMLAMVLAFSTTSALFLSRYLSYTTLGAAVLLAYWATRDRSRDVRLGVSAAVVLTVVLWG